jgi:hypothetical protein
LPPREAKGRYLTREYMADAEFHRAHDANERELYMLLALFTDDAGWLEWDPEYLAFSILRYDPDREINFACGYEQLVNSGRLRIYKCGHALMPKVANRPRPGEHEYRVRDQHVDNCKSGKSRRKSTRVVSLPEPEPNLTLPKRRPQPNVSSTQHRGRARGGAPQSLKEIVGWEPPKD